jgi:hypothetical protein
MIIESSTPDFRDGDMGWDNPFRHMVVICFPSMRKDGVVELGAHCERCREKAGDEDEGERREKAGDEDEGERRWNVRYSKERLVEHLRSCR